MQWKVIKIRKALEHNLDERRFEHTLGVSYTAAVLAFIYDVDVDKAKMAGLLHDCAKCIPDKKKIDLCAKYKIPMTDIEKKLPYLLHAKLGSFIAMQQYHVMDKDIMNAILNHITGCPEMTTLEKIIFIADYIEPNRKDIPGLYEIRKIAFDDLDLAVLKTLENILAFLNSSNTEIDDRTRITYEYYKDLIEKRSIK